MKRPYDTLKLKGGKITEITKTEITGNEKAKLLPTDTGIVVNDFLMEYFPEIMDFNFTANVEKEFDEVAEGEKEWTGMMDSFYKGFHPLVDKTIHSKTEHKVGERVLGTDPVSGKPVSVKIVVSVRLFRLVLPMMKRNRVLRSWQRDCLWKPLRWKKRWMRSSFPVRWGIMTVTR